MILRIYYIRSKVSISMYCSIVKRFGFNQNIEIESQHFEFRNQNARGTNSGKKRNLCVKMPILCNKGLKYKIKNHRTFKFSSHEIRNYETTIDLTHDKS